VIDIFCSSEIDFYFFVKLYKQELYPITWRWEYNQVFTFGLKSDPFTNHFPDPDDVDGLEAAVESESTVRARRSPLRPSVDVSLQVASVKRVSEVCSPQIIDSRIRSPAHALAQCRSRQNCNSVTRERIQPNSTRAQSRPMTLLI
jgi:hypothetical protein